MPNGWDRPQHRDPWSVDDDAQLAHLIAAGNIDREMAAETEGTRPSLPKT